MVSKFQSLLDFQLGGELRESNALLAQAMARRNIPYTHLLVAPWLVLQSLAWSSNLEVFNKLTVHSSSTVPVSF